MKMLSLILLVTCSFAACKHDSKDSEETPAPFQSPSEGTVLVKPLPMDGWDYASVNKVGCGMQKAFLDKFLELHAPQARILRAECSEGTDKYKDMVCGAPEFCAYLDVDLGFNEKKLSLNLQYGESEGKPSMINVFVQNSPCYIWHNHDRYTPQKEFYERNAQTCLDESIPHMSITFAASLKPGGN